MYDIYHSGIKGQRKGIRRYQYANKTYTPAGNERYRPKKGTVSKVATVTTAGLATAGYLNAVNSTTGLSVTLGTALANLNTNLVLLGAEVVAGFAAIPAPVYAITIPMALMMAPTMVRSGQSYVKKLKNKKTKKKE